jgi:hypothetical protein
MSPNASTTSATALVAVLLLGLLVVVFGSVTHQSVAAECFNKTIRSIAHDRPTSSDPMPNFRQPSVMYPSEAPGEDCPLNSMVVHPTILPYRMLGLCQMTDNFLCD